MTPATAIFHQAAIAGYQPAEFIGQILAFGKARQNRAAVTPVAPQPIEAASTAEVPVVTEAITQPIETPVSFSDPASQAPYLAPATPPTKSMAFDPATELMNYQESEQEPTPAHTNSAADGPTFKTRALDTLKSLWRMLKSGYFWKNALAAVLFFVVCFFILRTGLGLYTSHGSSTELPNFVDMLRPEAEALADDLGLTLKFEKGAFDPNRPAGMVVLQHPRAGSGVKKNRSIYLTILSDEAPMIQLPGLVGNYDYTQYTTRLEKSADIKSRIREQVYDPKQEENTILHFFYGDQKITDADLRAGVKVPQGSELEFVVTVRQTGEVSVPNIKCKRFGVVEFLLDGSDLLVGKVYGDVSDRSEAYVVRTEPPGGKMVPVGSKFDIYLAERKPDGCD